MSHPQLHACTPVLPPWSPADLRELWHYRPDFDYRPDLYEYTQTHTSDPDYVVEGVQILSPGTEHSYNLHELQNALQVLIEIGDKDAHVVREVMIAGIPGNLIDPNRDLRDLPRDTGAVVPDMAVWAGPRPTQDIPSYPYKTVGVPLLIVEVVSHSSAAMSANDLVRKKKLYALMGIQEYWLLDSESADTLTGFTLDVNAGPPMYRPIPPAVDGGLQSRVLDAWLRWDAGVLQCRDVGDPDAWIRVLDIPIRQSRAEVRAEVRAEARAEVALQILGPRLHRLLDAAVPGAADQVLRHWVETPPVHWPSEDTLARLAAAPAEWRLLLLDPR